MAGVYHTKRFIYQIAAWTIPTTHKLADILGTAPPGPEGRAQKLSEDATETTGTWCKIVKERYNMGIYSGKLVLFTHGLKQNTVRVRGEATEEPEGFAEPPEQHEFSSGDLYFLVEGNHVVLAQTRVLRIRELNDFINWFLSHHRLVQEGQRVVLESISSVSARQILDATVPKSVTFERVIKLPDSVEDMGNGYQPRDNLGALDRMLGVEDIRNQMPAALDGTRLRASVTFEWNSRVSQDNPTQALNALKQMALRDLDEDPDTVVVIETKRGKLSRKQLSLAESVRMPTVDGRLQTPTVINELFHFLQRLRAGNEIVD